MVVDHSQITKSFGTTGHVFITTDGQLREERRPV